MGVLKHVLLVCVLKHDNLGFEKPMLLGLNGERKDFQRKN